MTVSKKLVLEHLAIFSLLEAKSLAKSMPVKYKKLQIAKQS